MKKYFLFLLCICSNFVYAQEENCGSHINCDPATEYPYLTCDGTFKCSNDPTTLSPSVITAPVPVCLEHFPTDGPPNEVYLIGGTGTTKVFDMNEVVNDIDCAQNQWACVCGKQNEPCECHINLIWSKRNNDFPNPRNNLAIAHCVYVKGLCCIACSEYNTSQHAYICFNNTNSFINKVNGIQSKAFVNKDVVYSAGGGMCKAFNFCDVLTHELGHIYGIDHYDEFHCNSSSSSTEPTTGIMNSTIDANTPYRGLSNDDKCHFALLYCSSVGVEDEESLLSNIQVKTYPSPAQNILNIEFNLNQPVVDLIFQVFSENGKLVYENNSFYNDVGLNRISEDFSFLNNGTYFYKLKNDRNEFISGKFIIAK